MFDISNSVLFDMRYVIFKRTFSNETFVVRYSSSTVYHSMQGGSKIRADVHTTFFSAQEVSSTLGEYCLKIGEKRYV